MPKMRAKMAVVNIEEYGSQREGEPFVKTGERLFFNAVPKPEPYPEDGADEDNTYAKWSPSADCSITVANPALFDKFKVGEKYYVDFTLADS